jgi:crotonobetainyl-CoA:carnitine CoA-transferase CaiB-like acyl-CoA transferase
MNAGALDGIKVLEFASYVSGPFAGMLLSDLGAEVVKVESPEGGDPFRMWGKTDYNGTFGSMNRNKKSVTLDLKTQAGQAAARQLALGTDVIIENFRSGAMERLGLGYEALAVDNPRLVYCSITGFGSEGPYRSRAGYDTIGQAVSGLLAVLTDRKAPQPMGVSLSDHLAGTFAAYGVLAALMARSTSGRGQRVETSLLQATLAFLGENAATFFDDGKVPTRATRCQRAQVFAFTAGDRLPFVVHLSSP